jgi:hypothetical protein
MAQRGSIRHLRQPNRHEGKIKAQYCHTSQSSRLAGQVSPSTYSQRNIDVTWKRDEFSGVYAGLNPILHGNTVVIDQLQECTHELTPGKFFTFPLR